MTDLTIVIPAYNEEQRIEKTLTQFLNFFRTTDLDFELLIITNNCTDSTPLIVEEFSKKNKEVSFKNFPQLGEKGQAKGQAVIEGINLAKGNLIAFADADNATKAATIYELAKKIEGFDCIIGSRWESFFKLNDKIKKSQPISRKIASRCFNLLVRSYLNLNFNDTQAGAKVFKSKPLQEILPTLKTKGWAFDVSILYKLKKRKYKIKSVTIEWEDNPNSTLKIRKAVPNMLKTVIKLKFER